MRNEAAYLEDIRIAVNHLDDFLRGVSRAEFVDDAKTRFAVERLLITIGETANNIGSVTKDQYPEVPWKRLTQLRNFYVHGYERLTPTEVWSTSKGLIERLKVVLGALESASEPEDLEP